MCGIVGYLSKGDAYPALIKGLKRLEYRGYDSAGIAAFTKEGLRVVKARGRIANLEEKIREEDDMYCTCGIGHTRWATHGEPSDRNSHPHLGGKDGKGKVAVVHNGIIENYKELRERLEYELSTIKNMGYIGRVGMKSTDKEILNVMIDKADVDANL